jgi:2-polyprenyl-6-methoxyphenol hydroxylase-like FAD-dependent oxidoreductase
MAAVRRALIIGGGIGGLAAAVALRRVGIESAVFERAPEIREVGAGLSLWSNAVKALRRLRVEEAVTRAGSVIETALTVDRRGRVLSEVSMADLGRRCGADSVCAHRADLQRVLLEAAGPGRVRTGAECVAVEERPAAPGSAGGVAVRFADGSTEEGDLLIGADGIRSVVRRSLFGPTEPRYAGYATWRGIARGPGVSDLLPAGRILFATGRGSQVGVFHCGPGRIYWFATKNGPAGAAESPRGRKAEVMEALSGWCEPVPAVVAATDEADIIRGDIIDRPPTDAWGRGRITLLGDAVHATTPNLGQGACQALEDAVVLADRVAQCDNPLAALRQYEEARRERTALVINQSRRLGSMLQWSNPVLVVLRNFLMRTSYARRQGIRLFEELLGYDPPELIAPTG